MTDKAPDFEISFDVDPLYVADVDETHLADIVLHVLEHEDVNGPLELGIWITNETEIRSLNRTYRNVDASTDVLSFGLDEDGSFVVAPDTPRHLGDIAISFPHVVRQANEYGHSRERELAYLLAHGVLHLLGHDHEDPAQARRMREHEEAVLGDLGITRGDDDEHDTTRA